MAVRQGDIGYGILSPIEALGASHRQAQISFVAAAYATGHGCSHLRTDSAILLEQGFRHIQQMLQRRWQVGHDSRSKMPTVSQGCGQLMANTTAQARFGHSNGQVVLPHKVCHCLFVLQLVRAKNSLAKALPNLGLQTDQ